MYPNPLPSHNASGFLSGGGEMGQLIRTFDWSTTPIGPIEAWPTSLLTTLGILLNSNFPMFLFWEKDLICFYNDAYRPSLGNNGKHPFALGKPGIEVWPEIWPDIEPIINTVLAGKKSSLIENMLLPIYRNGKLEDVYWTFSYSSARNDNGEIIGVIVVCNETTELIEAAKAREENGDLLRFAIEAAELGTWDLDPVTNKFQGNDRLKEWFGLPPESEIELSIAVNTISENDRKRVSNEIRTALQYESGGLYDTVYTIVHPKTAEQRIVRAKGKARFDKNKKAYRLNGTLQDITEQAIAHRKIEESETYFRELTETLPAIIWITAPDGRCTYLNRNWHEYTGQTPKEAEGFGWLDVTHPDDVEETSKAFIEANNNQQPFYTLYRLRNKNGSYRWTINSGRPKSSKDGKYEGMIGTVVDVHEQKLAEEKIIQSEHVLRLLIDESPIRITFLTGPEMIVRLANETTLKSWGRDSSVIGRPIKEILPELEGQPFLHILDTIYRSGKPYTEKNALAKFAEGDGFKSYYFDLWYIPLMNENGEVYGILANAVDVTEKVLARKKIEQAEEKARLAIDSADLGSYEINLMTDQMKTSKRFNAIWGVDYSIKRSEFAQYIHPDDREMREMAHQQSLITGNLHYETRIIWNNGSEHWLKIKGKVLYDQDNQPMTLLGVIQDVTEQKRFTEELAKQVQERTIQLSRSNDDLLQFAHVASHDLKEPIRKIKIFSNMIETDYGHLLPEKGVNYLQKVQNATERMFMMIEGVLTYSSLNASNQPIESIDINDIISNIEFDLEILIQQKNALIIKENLPIIEGASVLIFQLFYNLINNALKFSKSGQQSIITISAASQTDNVKITVSDNGIGLDPEYTHKIFDAFTRLNTKDAYEGTGLGLALCKRIVERHHGSIAASGIKGEKAVFTILLPIRQTDKIV